MFNTPDINMVGYAAFPIWKSDFSWPDFFTEQTLSHIPADRLKSEKRFLNSCMSLFKWQQGKHPKFCKAPPLFGLGRKLEERPIEEYTDDELDEMEAAEPWTCFQDCKNTIDLLNLMRPIEEYQEIFEAENYPTYLAIAVSGIPKTVENFPCIISSSHYLAASLVITEKAKAAQKVRQKMLAKAIEDGMTPAQKQRAGQKKGGQKTGERKKREGLATFAAIEKAYFGCLKDGVKPTIKSLMKKSGRLKSTVEKALPKIKKFHQAS